VAKSKKRPTKQARRKKKSNKQARPTNILNRSIRRDYELVDKYTAGLQLLGHEVKSLRMGNGDLRGSYVNLSKGELWLLNSYIAPYKNAAVGEDFDANRTRKLLVSKSELQKLFAAKQNDLTIVPTKLMVSGHYIKLQIATARGLKKYDNRQKIKAKIDVRESKNKKGRVKA